MITAAGLLVLLVGGALALPLILDVNQYRGLIQTEAEKAVGRKVTLGEMSLSYIPFGISVSPIEVQDLVTARSVTVGARLMPLLSGEVAVSKVVIEAPVVSLVRRADGTWSVADLATGSTAPKADAEPSPARKVSLSKLVISDGIVRLHNEAAGAAGALEVGLNLEASMTMEGDHVVAEATGRLTKGESSLDLQGSIDRRGETILVDASIPSSKLQAADLNALLAAGNTPLPFRFSTEDPVRLDARVKGDVASDDLQVAANVEVSRATFEHPSMTQPMRDISGKLAVEGDRITLNEFHGVIGGSDVGGTLTVENFEAPKATFALTSKKADFWELMSFVKGDDGKGTSPKSAAAPAAGNDLLDAVRAQGTLAIGEGSFGGLKFSDLDSTLSLEKKIIRLEPASMTLYGGKISGNVSMNMNGTPVVSLAVKGNDIAVDPLLVDTLALKDTLAGTLTGDLSITASGNALDPILRSAAGSGDIKIENGRVGALNVLSILTKASGLLGEKSLKSVSNKLATEGTDFTSVTAGLKVGGGTIATKDLRLVSGDLDLTDDGTLDMLAGTLEVEGRIIFSEAISQAMVDEGSRAVDAFWDSSIARVSLPLKLAGPVSAPMPVIEWGAVRESLARNKIEEALRKRGLGDLLGGGSKAPARTESAAKTQDAGEVVERSGPGAVPEGGATVPLDASIQRKEFSGNLLAPDLKIRGSLRGAKITAASLEVLDRDGRQVHEASLMKEVRDFYATVDPAAPSDIKFRVEVDGKKLVKAGHKVAVAIKLQDEAGNSVTKRWEVER